MNVCYGFDDSGGRPAIVRAERTRGRVRTAEAAEIPASAPAAACLSPRECLTRWLVAPVSSRRRAVPLLVSLLDVELPFALEDCVYAFPAVARTGGGRTEALAVAALRSETLRRIEDCRRLGVDPVRMDHEGIALWTESLRTCPPEAGTPDRVRVVARGAGGSLTLSIGRGSRYLHAQVVDAADTVTIERVLKGAVGSEPGRCLWFWCGPDAESAAWVDDMVGRLGSALVGASRVHDEPARFLARALAVRGLDRGRALDCNLRTGPLAHPAVVARDRAAGRWTGGLLAVAGLIMLCGGLTVSALAQRRAAAVDNAFHALAVELGGAALGAARGDDALLVASRSAEQRLEALRPLVAHQELSPVGGRVLAVVGAADPGLFPAVIDAGVASLRIEGRADQKATVDRVAAALKAKGISLEFKLQPGPNGALEATAEGSPVR